MQEWAMMARLARWGHFNSPISEPRARHFAGGARFCLENPPRPAHLSSVHISDHDLGRYHLGVRGATPENSEMPIGGATATTRRSEAAWNF
jgi:hypothetical protein